jgi:hypothetical protein
MEKTDRQMKEFMQQAEEARSGKGGGKGGGGNEGRKTGREENLGGKAFEIFRLFAGGEAEWHEWSTDLSVLVATRSMTMREVMKKVKDLAKTEKEVMTCAEVKAEMVKSDDEFEDDDRLEELKGVEKMSRELYMWLRLRTEGEAKLVVGSLEEEDGIMAWGKLHTKYSQKTMSRLMRLQQDCMYPEVVKVGELVEKLLQWEEKWEKWRRSSRWEKMVRRRISPSCGRWRPC